MLSKRLRSTIHPDPPGVENKSLHSRLLPPQADARPPRREGSCSEKLFQTPRWRRRGAAAAGRVSPSREYLCAGFRISVDKPALPNRSAVAEPAGPPPIRTTSTRRGTSSIGVLSLPGDKVRTVERLLFRCDAPALQKYFSGREDMTQTIEIPHHLLGTHVGAALPVRRVKRTGPQCVIFP